MSLATPRRRRHALVLLVAPIVLALGLGVAAAPGGATQAAASSAPAADSIKVKVASFNILGSQHTKRSEKYAKGPKRARIAVRWLKKEGTSVMGMSEAQRNQIRVLHRKGGWRSFPRWKKATDTQTAQSVLWRPGRWKRVDAKTFTIPFHGGQQREQPMVLLQDKSTDKRLWVMSVHYTYSMGKTGKKERRIGMKRTIANVKKLQEGDAPVLLTGDMNSRRKVYCRVRGNTALDSPMGGSYTDESCDPPSEMRLDWIFGAARFDWSKFRFADGGRLDKVTDHTVPVATVTF